MAIVISKNGKNAKKVEKSNFDQEDYLQRYIYDNPESIPMYEIKEDIHLLILAREFATDSGPIDALAINKYGDLYIIETKLYKNPDKRMVIAQVLDYGASIWRSSIDFSDFLTNLEAKVKEKWQLPLSEKLQDFFQLDEPQVEEVFENMRQNLNSGNFKFMVLMDELHSRLKDLIIFINQNSRFDVYAVELEYYQFESYEIMIPRLYGAEVKKSVDSGSSSARRKWDEESVLADAKEKFTPDEFQAFFKIYEFCKENADQVNFGTGRNSSFSPIFNKLSPKSLFTLSSDTRLSFNFEWVAKDNEQSAEVFKEAMDALGFQFPENYKQIRPSVSIEEWMPKTNKLISTLKEMIS